MQQHNHRILSHAAVISANIIWGLYATICKDFLNSGQIGGWALCGLKMIGGALLFMLLWTILPTTITKKEKIANGDLLQLFIASLLINAGSQSCIILGLSHTSPIDGTVICSMAPIFTLLLATLLFRQRCDRWKMLGVTVGFAGALLFIFPGLLHGQPMTAGRAAGDNPLLGNALIVLSQIFGALYLLLFTKVLSKYNALTIITILFLFSGIVMLPFTITDILALPWTTLTTSTYLQLGYIIIFATGIAYLLLVVGQQSVSPTTIAMYNYIQPITALVSSLAIGVAAITLENSLATILCLLGVYIVIRR